MTPQSSIAILSPNGDTIWYNGKIATAMWQINSPIFPVIFYKTYLSYEDGDWVKITGHISLESNEIIVFHWVIPEDFEPLGNYRLKVEGWNDSWLVVETTSPSFLIQLSPKTEYGSVASWGLSVPPNISADTPFTISATVQDDSGNVIKNWDTPLTLGVFPGILNYLTLGNGTTTGTWANGTVSFAGYQLSNVTEGETVTIVVVDPPPTETAVTTITPSF